MIHINTIQLLRDCVRYVHNMFSWLQAITVASLFLLSTVASLARPDDTLSSFPESEFWAEVAGLMVTLPGRNPGEQEAASARHVIVVNEYHTDQLVRQSAAVRESDNPEDMLSGLVSEPTQPSRIYFSPRKLKLWVAWYPQLIPRNEIPSSLTCIIPT